jgi:hypothetical protein
LKLEDLKAYIESGILELYVLGDVTPAERLQVEAMAAKHPPIKAELGEIERSIELYASENAAEAPEYLKERILNSLLTNLADDRTFRSYQADGDDNPVAAFSRTPSVNFYKYAFAACLVLLLASIATLVSIYKRLERSNTLLASSQQQNERFSGTVSLMDHELGIFRDPTFKMLKLQGTAKSPASALMVAWSPQKKKVMIDMADAKMPPNDKDHQYQLWALVGGKPTDLGVFDADTTSKSMKEMNSVASAEAFAVTLEPRGGSQSPTMANMMVLGKF